MESGSTSIGQKAFCRQTMGQQCWWPNKWWYVDQMVFHHQKTSWNTGGGGVLFPGIENLYETLTFAQMTSPILFLTDLISKKKG